jgi:hypothetical protein
MPTPEDCTNGTDDDGDGATDCADSDCTPDYECADRAPQGWQGFFRLHTGPYPNPNPSACPDGASPQSFFSGPVPAACEPCACGTPGGGACAPAALSYWDGSAICGGGASADITGFLTDGACFSIPNLNLPGPRSGKVTSPAMLTAAGACTPSGGGLQNKDPWTEQEDVCGAPTSGGKGCGPQKACVPRGGGDYTSGVCIWRDGNQQCPFKYANTRIVLAQTATDDRACSACTCDTPTGVSCAGGSYTLFNNADCTGTSTPLSTTCADATLPLSDGKGAILPKFDKPTGGSCQPQGGEPSGSVTPTSTKTICCQ